MAVVDLAAAAGAAAAGADESGRTLCLCFFNLWGVCAAGAPRPGKGGAWGVQRSLLLAFHWRIQVCRIFSVSQFSEFQSPQQGRALIASLRHRAAVSSVKIVSPLGRTGALPASGWGSHSSQ